MSGSREYLHVGEIAHLLGISERTVRRWIADGDLPSAKIGGSRLVAKADLERLLTPAPLDLEEPVDDDGATLDKSTSYGSIGKALSE